MIMAIILGLLHLFLQPLFYIFLVFAFLVSYQRVLRERRDFRVRFYGLFDGVSEAILPGLLVGLAGSIVFVAVGVVLAPGMVALIAALYILAALTMQLRLMTPVFTVGLAVIFAYFFPDVHTGFDVFDQWIGQIRSVPVSVTALLLGFLMIMEGVLTRIRGTRTTPKLLPGKRGKTVGAHEARQFWFVPLCLLLPGGIIPHFDLWPLTAGGHGYSLLLVPFGFGFYRLISDSIPREAVIAVAKRSIYLGLSVVLLAVIALYYRFEWLALAAAALAILFRIVFDILEQRRRKRNAFYFRQRDDGLTVLGILPGSPAEKLGIRVGECIQKVNGRTVREEGDFYEALQKNAAFCRMEVIDGTGEIRFVQGALYDGSHHELGLLFIAPPKAVL